MTSEPTPRLSLPVYVYWCSDRSCETDDCATHRGPYTVGDHGPDGGGIATCLTAELAADLCRKLNKRAVNHHDELVEALRRFVNLSSHPYVSSHQIGNDLPAWESTIAEARSLLAKVHP